MRYLAFHKSIRLSSPLVVNTHLGQAARADVLHFPSVETQVQRDHLICPKSPGREQLRNSEDTGRRDLKCRFFVDFEYIVSLVLSAQPSIGVITPLQGTQKTAGLGRGALWRVGLLDLDRGIWIAITRTR